MADQVWACKKCATTYESPITVQAVMCSRCRRDMKLAGTEPKSSD